MDPASTSIANISTNRSAFSCGKHVGATQTGGNNKLNCFSLWNCRGLKSFTVPSKVPFIQDLLREEDQLFIALTETWLNEHKNAELLINKWLHYFTKIEGERDAEEEGTAEEWLST